MRQVQRTRRGTLRGGSMMAVAAAVALVASVAGMGTSSAETVTFKAEVTIPVAPASDFSSEGGGDGWDISLTPEAVYNVYHHGSELRVACHKQADASNCWTLPYKVVQDGGTNFGTPNHSSTILDPSNGHLYAYATRTSDSARGVVCIDTTLPAAATDLFCGFTALATATSFDSTVSPTAGVEIGSKVYAFNYEASDGVDGTDNTLMCFDMATESACATPNHNVGLPAASTMSSPGASISAVGARVYVPLSMNTGSWLACFDTTTGARCSGAWPVELPGSYGGGAPIPMLSTSASIIGVCLPTTSEWCYTLTGAVADAPPGLGAAMGTTNYYNAVPHTLEDRVYMASWEGNTVRCYDFGAAASCPNFPLAMENAGLVYTVNPDPQRPVCLWINADNGSAQIQNFDAFSGESCGAGPIRVLASAVVPADPECTPVDWTRLQVLDPAPDDYTEGKVAFRDDNGALIDGATDETLDGTGSADLTDQPLGNSRPQFLVTIEGHEGPIGEVTLELTWTGEKLAKCGSAVGPGGSDGPFAPPAVPTPGSPRFTG